MASLMKSFRLAPSLVRSLSTAAPEAVNPNMIPFTFASPASVGSCFIHYFFITFAFNFGLCRVLNFNFGGNIFMMRFR